MSLLSETHWVATLRLNAIRAISATVVWLVLYPIGRLFGVFHAPYAGESVLGYLALPITVLIFGLGLIIILRIAGSMGIPFMDNVEGLTSLCIMILIIPGDPLLWFLRKRFPEILPVENFNFINPHAIMLVQRA